MKSSKIEKKTYLNIAHCLEGGKDKHETEAQNKDIYKFDIHDEGNKYKNFWHTNTNSKNLIFK